MEREGWGEEKSPLEIEAVKTYEDFFLFLFFKKSRLPFGYSLEIILKFREVIVLQPGKEKLSYLGTNTRQEFSVEYIEVCYFSICAR